MRRYELKHERECNKVLILAFEDNGLEKILEFRTWEEAKRIKKYLEAKELNERTADHGRTKDVYIGPGFKAFA